MKILAIVVCYNPDVKELYGNIQKFVDHVDRLVIWQNSQDIKKELLLLGSVDEKVVFLGNGENKGIAFPLNQAFEEMFSNQGSYTHLLTMDQDSTWQNFEEYKNFIIEYNQEAIFSPNINHEVKTQEKILKVKTCITSGAVFPKEVLRKIGKFNEEYSVDCVDYDFCFRATDKKIDIIKVIDASLNQNYGQPMKSKYFNILNPVYSSKRLFFIVRNHMLLWRDFPKHIDLRFKKVILVDQIFGKLIKVILMEDSKIIKSASILKGFAMGLANKRSHNY